MKLLFACLCFATACGGSDEPPSSSASQDDEPKSERVMPRAVSGVSVVDVPLHIDVTGQVEAISQATLSSKVPGIVQRLYAREGNAVTKGQTLVVLESRDLQANLARTEAEAENAKVQLDRMEELFAEESVAKQELDSARRAYKVARANRRAARVQLSYTVIKAPFDGVVVDRMVEVGELASPGQPLIKVEDPLHLRLEAIVAEDDIKRVAVGDKTSVVINALNGESLEGTVNRILPAGDPSTHTFRVKVTLPSREGLRSGMFGRMQVKKGMISTMLIPKTAVVNRGELSGVYVVDSENMARLRWIKIGRIFGENLEAVSGLDRGERVVVKPAQVTEGVRIQITETLSLNNSM